MTKTKMSTTCDHMREESGNVTSDDPMVTLLYILARDFLPIGIIDKFIEEQVLTLKHGDKALFTNGWLANWAKYTSKRLQSDEGK